MLVFATAEARRTDAVRTFNRDNGGAISVLCIQQPQPCISELATVDTSQLDR